MRVTREQAEQNREDVLRVAARMFRERGVEGASVAEIFGAVGLTHGGLYGQFPGGKEALAAEAVGWAFAERRGIWDDQAASGTRTAARRAMVDSYVSADHLDDPGAGCPTPLMAAEAGRRGGPVREAYTRGVRDLLEPLERVSPGRTPSDRRRSALRTLTALAGAVLIARAVDDPALAEELLAAAATVR